jgi:hypothetical protein
MELFKRMWAGAALLTLFVTMTARASYYGRWLDVTIYMVGTFLALALAAAIATDH